MYFFHHLLLVALESLETTRISVQLGFHYFRSLSWLGRIWMEGVQGEGSSYFLVLFSRCVKCDCDSHHFPWRRSNPADFFLSTLSLWPFLSPFLSSATYVDVLLRIDIRDSNRCSRRASVISSSDCVVAEPDPASEATDLDVFG